MRNARRARVTGVILSALVVAACSSTQPEIIQTRDATLSFSTTASVAMWDCYQSPFVQCFPQMDGQIQRVLVRPVPWRYSLRITIIRAGTINEVVAESTTSVIGSSVEPGDQLDDFASLTTYDADQPPAPNRTEFGIDFTDGKQVSSASPIYLQTVFVDPGIPGILAIDAPDLFTQTTFDFRLNTGDTVIVKARKQSIGSSPQVSPPYTDVRLTASLAISGSAVLGQGVQSSTADDSAGFTFSFTVQ